MNIQKVVSIILKNTSYGAETAGEPYFEALEELYHVIDIWHLYDTVSQLDENLRQGAPFLLDELSGPRESEDSCG